MDKINQSPILKPAYPGRSGPPPTTNGGEPTYRCWHCRDGRYVYLPIVDARGRPDTGHPLFGRAMPCLWCAQVQVAGEGLRISYRNTEKGQEQRGLMEMLGCEVPG